MLLDSSAVVCVVLREAGCERLTALLERARVVAIGTPMVLEAGIVLTGRGVDVSRMLGQYLDAIGAEVLDFR